VDPIPDIFRTLHRNRFRSAQARSHKPVGRNYRRSRPKEKVTHSTKKMSPTDLAHFACFRAQMLVSGKGFQETIPITGGDCF